MLLYLVSSNKVELVRSVNVVLPVMHTFHFDTRFSVKCNNL